MTRQQEPNPWIAEFRALIVLSLPLCLVQAGHHLMGFVDTALAGRVDAATLGATGLGSQVFFTVTIIGLGICMGVDPLVSQAFGAGKHESARQTLWQGAYVGLLASVPLMAVILLLAFNLERFGVEPTLATQTRFYIYGRLPSIVPMLAGVALRSYLQAAHVVRPIVWAVVVTNIFNFLADYLLLFGDEGLLAIGLPAIGLPSLGVAGLGIASTIAVVVQLAMMAWALRYVEGHERTTFTPDPPNKQIQLRIAQIGWPIGLHLVAEVGVFALVGVLAGGMGPSSVAAHQVALSLSSMAFSVCLGLAAATAVQVGRAVGRNDPAAMRRAGFCGFAMGGAFMTLSASAMWLAPGALVGIITSDPQVLVTSTSLLAVAAGFQIVDGLQAVGAGALRGLGSTRFTFGANIVGHWLIGVPIGVWLAFEAGQGVIGLWWGLTAGLASVAVALFRKFQALSRQPVVAVT